MAEYEVLLNDLETQKAQLEIERGYKITKQDLLTFIEEILKGDVNDKDYQKQIIDHLVSQVFVSDDNTVIYFNLRGGKDIETLTVDDTKTAVNNAKRVRTQLPLARQRRLGLESHKKRFDKFSQAFFLCSESTRRLISIVLGERNDVSQGQRRH